MDRTDTPRPYEAWSLWMCKLGPINVGVIVISRFAGGRQILTDDKCLFVIERSTNWGLGLVDRKEKRHA